MKKPKAQPEQPTTLKDALALRAKDRSIEIHLRKQQPAPTADEKPE